MTYLGKRLSVFYHVARMGIWEAVDKEIMSRLTASGLLEHAEFVRNDCEDVSLFEFPTLDLLRHHAADNESIVLYLHTKGASNGGPSIDDWRACMLYWMVERWRECVDQIIKGYDAVGINRRETPMAHFQGNFWWATSSHINKLGDVRKVPFKPVRPKSERPQGERHKAEFWILSKPGKFYQPYNHDVRPYSQLNPRARYEGRPF